ncbi:MAG: hypothetical protein ABFQ53_00475 [Patescibacteria group bacterium]
MEVQISKYEPFREEILSGEISARIIAQKIGNGCKATHVLAAKRRFKNPGKCKKILQNWRKNNREEVNERNRKYVAKHSQHKRNKGKRWTQKEDELVLSSELAKNIAKKLERTIKAIYSRRTFLKKVRKVKNL